MALNPARVQSVDRAVNVLEMLASRGWAGVSEVAQELDVHRSTAYRILATLADRGLVKQDSDHEKYALGPAVLDLARALVADTDLVSMAKPTCQALCGEVGETVTLSVLKGDQSVVVCQALPANSVLTVDWEGTRSPLHVTAGGKVFLAFLSARERKALLSDPLVQLTSRTVSDSKELERQLIEIWDQGYGVSEGEMEEGLNAVAAPVRDSRGKVVAALSVSAPEFRLNGDSLEDVARRTVDSANLLSEALQDPGG